MNVIEFEQITKRYGQTTAIECVSFEVGKGEIFGIVGPNGAGKITMVEAIAGLRRIDSGRISVLDLDSAQQGPELRKRIGVQLQHTALQDRLKVWEALDLYASFFVRSVDQEELMAAWGLQNKRNAPFTTLSGG